MSDLTVIYYSANQANTEFLYRVGCKLVFAIPEDTDLITVTHKPMTLADRKIVVGIRFPSAYNIYKQILLGASEADTKYVACAEDDCLYTEEHFSNRPEGNEFIYNMNSWWIEKDGVFRYRERTGMYTCIAPRQLMIDTLETRFAKFPNELKTREELTGWGEPGRYEEYLGLPNVNRRYFKSNDPVITFNHKPSLGGLRKTRPDTDVILTDLAPWGNARELWDKIHG